MKYCSQFFGCFSEQGVFASPSTSKHSVIRPGSINSVNKCLFILFIVYVKLSQLVGRLTLIGTEHELCLNYRSVGINIVYQLVIFTPLRSRFIVYRSIRELDVHSQRYDMAQSTGYSKNALNINPFWEKAYVEPPLEWSKWTAILEMAVFAKDGIEVRNLLRARPPLVEPSEPV